MILTAPQNFPFPVGYLLQSLTSFWAGLARRFGRGSCTVIYQLVRDTTYRRAPARSDLESNPCSPC